MSSTRFISFHLKYQSQYDETVKWTTKAIQSPTVFFLNYRFTVWGINLIFFLQTFSLVSSLSLSLSFLLSNLFTHITHTNKCKYAREFPVLFLEWRLQVNKKKIKCTQKIFKFFLAFLSLYNSLGEKERFNTWLHLISILLIPLVQRAAIIGRDENVINLFFAWWWWWHVRMLFM